MPVAAFVAVSALYIGIAVAAPREVAIVNAASDQEKGAELADALRAELEAQVDLTPVPEGDVARALEDPLRPSNSIDAVLAQARLSIQRARDAQAIADYEAALAEISAGETVLLRLAHTPQVIALLAELNFESALIHLNRGDPTAAVTAFRAVRRLDPNRAPLDPRDYRPDVISGYDEAAAPLAPSATITVSSPFDGYDVWVDGAPVGVTKLTLDLPAGIHYITVSTTDYEVLGQRIELANGASQNIDLRYTRHNVDVRTRNRRRALMMLDASSNADQEAFRQGAQAAAEAAGVDAVIIIGDDRGELETALYSGRRDRLANWRAVAGVTLAQLIAPFNPLPKLVIPPDDDDDGAGPGNGHTRDIAWWKKRRYWVPIAIGGGLATAAAVITFALRGTTLFLVDPSSVTTE